MSLNHKITNQLADHEQKTIAIKADQNKILVLLKDQLLNY